MLALERGGFGAVVAGKGRGRRPPNLCGGREGVVFNSEPGKGLRLTTSLSFAPTRHGVYGVGVVGCWRGKLPRQEVKLDRQKNENEGLGASSVRRYEREALTLGASSVRRAMGVKR